MALYKVADYDPNYRDAFQGEDIKDMTFTLKVVMIKLVLLAIL